MADEWNATVPVPGRAYAKSGETHARFGDAPTQPGDLGEGEGFFRLSLRLSPEARRTLEEIAALRGGVSFAEVVRRALGTELYLIREQKEGARILVESPDKMVRQIILR